MLNKNETETNVAWQLETRVFIYNSFHYWQN